MTQPRALLALALLWPMSVFAQAHPRPEWEKGHHVRVKIDSTPPGATIYIDSKDLGVQGATPSEFKLPKGMYKIILELPGWKAETHDITVDRPQAFTFELSRDVKPAVLDVRSATDPQGGQSALGGQILIDGQAVGTVPSQIELAPGPHLLEVKRPGFSDFRDNVVLAEAERRTAVIFLVQQPRPGSILVTADVTGAEVFVDGQRRDVVPTVVSDLPEGDHTVEVRKEGSQPWRQVVHVSPGQQIKVVATLPLAVASAGSIKVVSSNQSANVILDGTPVGPVNAEIHDVRPGVHVLEVQAQGLAPKRVEVTVRTGEVTAVPVELSPAMARGNATLRVISAEPDVEVFVDGASLGKAPVERNDLTPGKHYVLAHKPGLADFKTEVDLQAGRAVEVSADLHASGSLRALSNPTGADVLLDGNPVGKAPLTLPDVPAGDHLVEFKLGGYQNGKAKVLIEAGQQKIAQADLAPEGQTPQTVEEVRSQSSFGATTIDRFHFNVDVGTGHPYFLWARVTTGVFRIGNFGGDIGLELRSNFYETDIGVRPRVQLFRADPFAVGMDMAILGGGGPTQRNSFTFEVGPIATLIAGNYIHVSFKPYLQVYSDRLCPSITDIMSDDAQTGDMKMGPGMSTPGSGQLYRSDEKQICKAFDDTRNNYPGLPKNHFAPGTFPTFGQSDPRDRFSGVRLMLQGSLEVAVHKNVNLWFMVEGAPFQDQRQAFTSKFNAAFPDTDFPFYARFGITGKF